MTDITPDEQPVVLPDLDAVLATPMAPGNDAGAATVGDYLRLLLREVWTLEESFSGKRAFGNSSWKGEVQGALSVAGLYDESSDRFGYDHLDAIINAAIDHAFTRNTQGAI